MRQKLGLIHHQLESALTGVSDWSIYASIKCNTVHCGIFFSTQCMTTITSLLHRLCFQSMMYCIHFIPHSDDIWESKCSACFSREWFMTQHKYIYLLNSLSPFSKRKGRIMWNLLKLTQQRECDSKDEDHDTATQRQHKVTGDHDPNDEQSGVLLLKIPDGGLVLSCPH